MFRRERAPFVLMAAAYLVLTIGLLASGRLDPTDVSLYAHHAALLFGETPERASEAGFVAFRTPLYSILLGLLKLLTGSAFLRVALIVNVLMLIAAYRLAIRVMEEVSGRVRPWLYPGILFANVWMLLEVWVVRETILYTLLLVSCVYVATVRRSSRTFGLELGAVAGLAILARPTGIVVIACGLLVIASLFLRRDSRRFATRALVQFFVALALLVAPWQLYLYSTVHSVELSGSCTSGLNLFKGNHSATEGIYTTVDIDRADAFLETYIAARRANDPRPQGLCERDEHLRRLAVDDIMADKPAFVKRLLIKAVLFVSPVPTPLGRGDVRMGADGRLHVDNFELRNPGMYVAYTYHSFVLVLFVLGCFAWRLVFGRAPRVLLVIAGIYLAHAVLYSLVMPEYRYHQPLYPLLAIVAGLVCGRFYGLARDAIGQDEVRPVP